MRECYTSKVLSKPPYLIAKIKLEKSVKLTLFVTGGGIKCPHYQESVRHFPMGNARITKTLDFVPLSTRHIPAKPFFKISIFKKNIKRCQKYPKGGPFCEFQIFGVSARNSVFLMA